MSVKVLLFYYNVNKYHLNRIVYNGFMKHEYIWIIYTSVAQQIHRTILSSVSRHPYTHALWKNSREERSAKDSPGLPINYP